MVNLTKRDQEKARERLKYCDFNNKHEDLGQNVNNNVSIFWREIKQATPK